MFHINFSVVVITFMVGVRLSRTLEMYDKFKEGECLAFAHGPPNASGPKVVSQKQEKLPNCKF